MMLFDRDTAPPGLSREIEGQRFFLRAGRIMDDSAGPSFLQTPIFLATARPRSFLTISNLVWHRRVCDSAIVGSSPVLAACR